MEPDDQQLIANYRAGDEAALERLIGRHLKAVYVYVRHFIGESEDTEDIVQEVFMKAWKHIGRYKPSASFKTWLFAIAHNTAIDHLRKRKDVKLSLFENEEGENVITETLSDPEPLPDELAARAFELKEVEALLRELSPRYREVLLLHYNEHLTFEEISSVLRRPLDTVKSQHRRALIMLRKSLLHQNDPARR